MIRKKHGVLMSVSKMENLSIRETDIFDRRRWLRKLMKMYRVGYSELYSEYFIPARHCCLAVFSKRKIIISSNICKSSENSAHLSLCLQCLYRKMSTKAALSVGKGTFLNCLVKQIMMMNLYACGRRNLKLPQESTSAKCRQ